MAPDERIIWQWRAAAVAAPGVAGDRLGYDLLGALGVLVAVAALCWAAALLVALAVVRLLAFGAALAAAGFPGEHPAAVHTESADHDPS
jgi:hypothetical protein